MRQKIVSAVTSGEVPDLFQNTPGEIIALWAWDDKFVDVSDVVATQKEEFTETALLTAYCYNNVKRERSYYGVPYTTAAMTKPHLALADREGRLPDRGHPKDLGRLLRFLQGCAEEFGGARFASSLRDRLSAQQHRQRLQRAVQ